MASPWSVNDLYGVYASGTAMDDAGNRPIMSQAQFDALPEAERFKLASLGGSGGETSIFQDGQNFVGYGDPRFIGQGGFYGGMTTGPDGKFTLSGVDTDKLDAIQRQTDQSGFFNGTPLQNIMKGTGIVLGAGALNNYLMDGSIFGGSSGGYGGALPESAAPQVTETMAGSPWGGMTSDIAPGYLSESVAPQVTETMAGSPFGGSMWQNALNYATSNPLQTARGVGGLLGAATSLGGNQSPQGSPSGYQGPSGPVPSFNPVGAAGQFQQTAYKPMQFDPVPFMGDSTMFQNYSPYGNSGFTGMGMPGQNPTMGGQGLEWGRPNAAGQYGGYDPYRDRPPGPFDAFAGGGQPMQRPTTQTPGGMIGGMVGGNMSPGGYQNQWGSPQAGMGYNQASPVTLPWQQQNPSFGKPYNQPSQPPMGYAGSGPIPPGMTGNYTSPVQLPGGWGQPSQGAAQGAAQGMGGLLGNMGSQGDFGPQLPRPNPYGQSSIPGMDNRTAQMMARYLPGSGAGVDPLASPGSVNQAGGWQNFARQNYGPKVGGMFNQFMQANPGMNSYEDWRQRYPGM